MTQIFKTKENKMKVLDERHKKLLRSTIEYGATREDLENSPYSYLIKVYKIPYKKDTAKFWIRKWRNDLRWKMEITK